MQCGVRAYNKKYPFSRVPLVLGLAPGWWAGAVMADFGQTHCDLLVCLCACVAWVLVSRFPCGGFKVLVWSCSVPTRNRSSYCRSQGPPLAPDHQTSLFFPSLAGVFLVDFGGVSEDRDPQMWTSRIVV